MSNVNPYASSGTGSDKTPLASMPDSRLASRWHRLAASLVDSAILLVAALVPTAIVMIGYGVLIDPSYLEASEPSIIETVMVSVLFVLCMAVAFLAFNGYLLMNRGQTIGKYLLKIQMVGDDGELVSLSRIFMMRYLLFWIFSMFPILSYISIFDCLMIFGEQKKCLHDRVAGTKVISLR